MDQANGLRRAVQAKPTRYSELKVPVVHAHLLPVQGMPKRMPPCVLVWHWHQWVSVRAGWDLQSRLHVVGPPRHLSGVQLSQWRALFSEWHLCARSLEVMLFADVGWIWLEPRHGLLERLRPVLHWLCRNRPDLPIILAGFGETTLQRVRLWASARFPLRYLEPETAYSGGEHTRTGYYRLVRWCIAPLHRSIKEAI